jgi:hypothetical protein
MASKPFTAIVKRIIKNHGPVIDLERNPEVLLEILRQLGAAIADEPNPPDNPCGGTPPGPTPPPPPGPSSIDRRPSNDDLMRAIKTLTREMGLLRKSISGDAVGAKARTASRSRR